MKKKKPRQHSVAVGEVVARQDRAAGCGAPGPEGAAGVVERGEVTAESVEDVSTVGVDRDAAERGMLATVGVALHHNNACAGGVQLPERRLQGPSGLDQLPLFLDTVVTRSTIHDGDLRLLDLPLCGRAQDVEVEGEDEVLVRHGQVGDHDVHAIDQRLVPACVRVDRVESRGLWVGPADFEDLSTGLEALGHLWQRELFVVRIVAIRLGRTGGGGLQLLQVPEGAVPHLPGRLVAGGGLDADHELHLLVHDQADDLARRRGDSEEVVLAQREVVAHQVGPGHLELLLGNMALSVLRDATDDLAAELDLGASS